MPRHDFYCGVCGQLSIDIYVPVTIGATAGAPDHCGVKMAAIPAAPALDLRSDGDSSFQKFETTDGSGQRVLVDSLRKLRQIERESEQAHRNGEGQPMVWRRYAQDDSNGDAPTLGSYAGGEQPTDAAKRRFGSTLQKSAEAPDGTYGPGVSDTNASALPMAGGE